MRTAIALGGKSHADELLWAQPAEAPEAAFFTGGRQHRLAGGGLPYLRAVPAPNLEIGSVARRTGDPVEAVAAQIHHPATVILVRLIRRPHRVRWVFRM